MPAENQPDDHRTGGGIFPYSCAWAMALVLLYFARIVGKIFIGEGIPNCWDGFVGHSGRSLDSWLLGHGRCL